MNAVGEKNFTFFRILNIAILALFTFICFYPIWYVFINSMSTGAAVSRGVYVVPINFTLEAYLEVFKLDGLVRAAGNSFVRSVAGPALSMLLAAMLGFLFTNRFMPCRKLIYRYFVVTMYVSGGLIPSYIINSKLGFRNNFLVYIIPGCLSAWSMIMYKTFLESMDCMPVVESAEIDGAGLVQTFIHVVLPLTKPILACFFIFGAVGAWNDWFTNFIYISGPRGQGLNVIAFLLYRLMQSAVAASGAKGADDMAYLAERASKVSPLTLRMAMSVVTMIPIMCVYPLMQKYFASGFMLGAIKG